MHVLHAPKRHNRVIVVAEPMQCIAMLGMGMPGSGHDYALSEVPGFQEKLALNMSLSPYP